LDFKQAKEEIKFILENGTAIKKALESRGITVGDIGDDENQVYLDEWTSLALDLKSFSTLDSNTSITTLMDLIKTGKIGGVEFEKEVNQKVFKPVYSGGPDMDLKNRGDARVYRGWSKNLFGLLNDKDVLASKDLASAAQNAVKLMGNFANSSFLDEIASYIANDTKSKQTLNLLAEGWQSGIATFWAKVYTAVKDKKGEAAALDFVKKELTSGVGGNPGVRKQIRDALVKVSGAQIETNILDGGYVLSVVNRLEELLNYSQGEKSRDESLKRILNGIAQLTYDSVTKKFYLKNNGGSFADMLNNVKTELKGLYGDKVDFGLVDWLKSGQFGMSELHSNSETKVAPVPPQGFDIQQSESTTLLGL